MQKALNLFSSLFLLGVFCLLMTNCSSSAKKTEAPAIAPTAAVQAPTTTAQATPATPTVAKSQSSESISSGNYSCAKGSDVHTTSVASKDGGCELTYVKAGATSTPAHAHKGTQYCVKKAERIKSNLETAGYTCKAL